MENRKIMVSSTPHIRSDDSVRKIMLDVLIALSPAAVIATYFFGIKAVLLMVISIASSMLFEAGYQLITKQKISVLDLSAAVTGALLAFNLPANTPLWIPVIGSFFAIVIIKQIFGGIGQNFINPALGARAFLLAAYPVEMTDWSALPLGVDAVSFATPLVLLEQSIEVGVMPVFDDYINAFLGNVGGCLGETSAVALLIGGLYLIARRVISWRIPVAYGGTLMLLTWVFGRNGWFTGIPVYELLIGGFLLGAFFMATDYSTSPISPLGQIIMGIGCGILTAVIRIYSGGYPEGVSYSILLMNLVVPIIDKFVKPRIFGVRKKRWFKKESVENA